MAFSGTIKRKFRACGRSALRAIILAFCAGERQVLAHVDIEDVREQIELYIQRLSIGRWFGYKVFLLLVEYAVPPFTRKVRPARFLSLEKRTAYLSRGLESRWVIRRMPFVALKFIILSHLYAQPALLQAIGYGPAMKERKARKCTSMEHR